MIRHTTEHRMHTTGSTRIASLRIGLCLLALSWGTGFAQQANVATNSAPDPYERVDGFFKPPPGRTLGSSSGVALDRKGNIWIADRCGVNNCAGSTLDPIMEFDAKGIFIKSFGSGKLLFPHGLFIDRADHIWVTDGHVGERKGDDVLEFDRNGKLLRILGKPGVSGSGPGTFHEPNAVLVAPNGDIFVADGHEPGLGNARVVKLDSQGRFIKQWGSHGNGPGQFEAPHTLAMDSKGRLFVGDRGNDRIQIFDQNGNLLLIWTQFSRPSGVFVDSHDTLYVTDSESRAAVGYGHHPGWKRGIRIGSARDGVVTAFIPDLAANQENRDTTGGEGVTADGHGAVYSAEVGTPGVVKYEKR
jgi:sugar lactone lactonase YvrE